MPTVALIDNDVSHRDPGEAALRAAGFDVLTAADGVAGLQLVREKHPFAVVLELLLPKLHGFALCQEIHNAPELRYTTKVLVTSLKSYPADIRKVLELGAVHFLTKPFPPEELVAAIRKASSEMLVPANEIARLAALRGYRILDTPPESVFDDLARLASLICECPMAMVSLVDKDRQWFKSKVGTELQETSRDVAFCAHAILQPKVLVVPDATKDERFRSNMLVTCEPKLRFYAGAPLVNAKGEALGTVCVVDTRPRQLSPAQLECLTILARIAVDQLESRAARRSSKKTGAARGSRVSRRSPRQRTRS
jgi:CheY-like chemotaxis protein